MSGDTSSIAPQAAPVADEPTVHLDQLHFEFREELDGVRGVAILLTLPFHAHFLTFKGAFVGVDLFFVLSGYLITSLLLIEHRNNGRISMKSFYARRALRLLPAYVLFLLCINVFVALFNVRAAMEGMLRESLIAFFYLTNWAAALNIYPPKLLNHTWSLAIEEQYYLLWPGLLGLILWRWRSINAVFLVLVTAILCVWVNRYLLAESGATIHRLYCGLDTRLDSLFSGSLVAVLLSSQMLSDRRKHDLAVLFRLLALPAICYLLWVVFYMSWLDRMTYKWAMCLVGISGGVIIGHVVTCRESPVSRLLALRPLTYIGRVSYGMYLWHWPVFAFMLVFFQFSKIEILVLGGALSFVLALASYYGVERYFLRLKKRYAIVR